MRFRFWKCNHFSHCIILLSMILLSVTLSNCGGGTTIGNPAVEDSSASGLIASSVGGALLSSSSQDQQAAAVPLLIKDGPSLFKFNLLPSAWASDLTCPRYTSVGADCSTSGSTLLLNYDRCSFANSATEFHGTLALVMSSGTATCGQYPHPGALGTLTRQFVRAINPNQPWYATATSGQGAIAVIDHVNTNLRNFDNQPISALANDGYGTQVSFNASGGRAGLHIAQRIAVLGVFDHSISGNLSINESASAPSSRSVSGSISVYHNVIQVVGSSTLENLVFNNDCCLPISGTITTSFVAGQNVAPTSLGERAIGRAESLTLTGCGTGTLVDYDGNTTAVELQKCH